MVHKSSQLVPLITWQAILWRVLLTVILLLILAGPGLVAFEAETHSPTARAVPTTRLAH